MFDIMATRCYRQNNALRIVLTRINVQEDWYLGQVHGRLFYRREVSFNFLLVITLKLVKEERKD